MNKKEVLEIRKQFTPENCTITRICGCYVDHEKEKKMEMKKAFLSMPEEEAFKYFDIFRHTLSGTVGKNLMTMEFPLNQELEGGAQELLLRLRDTKLTDDLLLEEFYDKVIENYEFAENYYIILIHAAYDVPGKSSDNMEMFDASDTVYEHIMCSICPVKLTKAGIYYTAYYLVTGQMSLAAVKGLEAVKIAFAIVLGIIFVVSIPRDAFQIRYWRAKRKRKRLKNHGNM